MKPTDGIIILVIVIIIFMFAMWYSKKYLHKKTPEKFQTTDCGPPRCVLTEGQTPSDWLVQSGTYTNNCGDFWNPGSCVILPG